MGATDSATLAEVIRTALDARLEGVHTAMPGTVVAYDPATQTATIGPVLKRVLYDVETGDKVYEELPEIPNVPVVFPRGGGYCMTWPLSAGDAGLLVFSERSFAEWRTTGETGEPTDVRRHGLGYPVFLAGIAPATEPLAAGDLVARETRMVIGQDGAEKQIRIGPTGITLGATPLEHVMTAEAACVLIYNVFQQLTVALAGPWVGATIQPLIAAAITTALTAQVAPAPAGAVAQGVANGLLQAGIAAGAGPVNTLLTAWKTQLAALATKTPDASGLFPSAGSRITSTE